MIEPQWGDLCFDNDTGCKVKWFPLHEGQRDIMNSQARFLLALGGADSGKTSLGTLWFSTEIQKFGGAGHYLVCTPTFSIGLSSTLEAWEATVSGTVLKGRMIRDNANPRYILGTGGTVYFKSAGGDFEGLKPNCAWLDEGCNVSEEVFNKCVKRLGHSAGRLLITSTPYLTYNWVISRIMRTCDQGNPLYYYRCFPSWMNPTTDKAHIEEERKRLPPWRFAMDYEGRFEACPGLVYELIDRNGNNAIVDEAKHKGVAYFGAIDWGGNDPTCILIGQIDDTETITIVKEHYTREPITDTLNTIKALDKEVFDTTGRHVRRWFCDHRPENIRVLRKAGLAARSVRKGANSIVFGISLVQSRLRLGSLHFVRTACPNLLREIAEYRYAMAEGVVVGEKPLPGNDHAMDALSYLVRGIDHKQFRRLTKYHYGDSTE